ncbi:ribonuclease H [Mycobacteroides abscessus subsp. bolletii]|uniref:Ribonuclease H n=2 Tax=Mycobacteroides TaxID=670516 RepID=A0A9Q7WGX4_9MYCO|nr:RNase H family protein [Mycobacteroides abscessus]SHT90715.1 ribonuclease H [Mycobacteroides abscessus subsp. bolletii]SHU02428.1 ribonuclease H [Mycobacteroides abscessus subsp. bolletii]SHW81682.1 ribonuclease H [Mycobacteroides abscessus subsp. bolletii]SIC63550.1 ribonuclease H [Mycobacteroides abscessus subsp. abscessus]SIE28570.1 ribonuclease H [Mycobacteroides abscessus subsp. abscessus]
MSISYGPEDRPDTAAMAIHDGDQSQSTRDESEFLPPTTGATSVVIAFRGVGSRRGYAYCAKSATGIWSGIAKSPNLQTALFDAIATVRAAQPALAHLQVLASTRVVWAARTQLNAIQSALNVTIISGAEGYVRLLMGEAAQVLDEIAPVAPEKKKSPKPRPPETLLPPVTVATDGSVRKTSLGCGWLADSGAFGLRGFQHSNRMHGGSKVLISELRGIDEALRRLGRHEHITLFTDCQAAITMAKAWQRGEQVMPGGYITELGEGEEAELVSAFRRIHRLRERVEIRWVRSHSGEPLNEGADALARLASRYMRGDSGLSRQEYRQRAAALAEAFAGAFCATTAAA